MSITEAKPVKVQPKSGPMTRAALTIPDLTPNQRKLLFLLAAYREAGEHSPPVADLARRMGIKPRAVDTVLLQLIKKNVIRVAWANKTGAPRNVYFPIALGDVAWS